MHQSFPKVQRPFIENVAVLFSNYPAVSKKPDYPVLAGESLNLQCRVEPHAGPAEPLIHWLDQHGDKVEGSEATHTFTATDQHNGQWTCVVTRDGTVSSGKILISVAGESNLSFDSFSLIQFLGGNCLTGSQPRFLLFCLIY